MTPKATSKPDPDVPYDVPDELREPDEEELSEMFVKRPKKRRPIGKEA